MEKDSDTSLQIGKSMKERSISLVVLAIMIITIWYMLDIVLLTFVIAFIFYNLLQVVQKQTRKMFHHCLPDGCVISLLYGLAILVLIIAISEFVPKLTVQVLMIADVFKSFDMNAVKEAIDPRLASLIGYVDINKYVYDAGSMLGSWAGTVGGFGLNIFLSCLLSYFLLLEKSKIRRFGEQLEKSKISFIYHYLITFGTNFVQTFSKVMKVQVTIALINCVISMILLRMLGFPQILILGIMIFVLGLIPVAGVIVSLIPLSVIAFSIGGINKVIAVILMVVVIHMLEAYVLNPKLMSSKTELPVCFVFIILLVGEHYIGVWGLLIGVPVFIFLMSALDVEYGNNGQVKKQKKLDAEGNKAKKEKKR